MNDAQTQKAFSDAMNQEGGAIMVQYKDLSVLVPRKDVEWAISEIKKGGIGNIITSLTKSLNCSYPYVLSGSATQREAMHMAQDIAIWFANEIVEGRQNLPPSSIIQ